MSYRALGRDGCPTGYEPDDMGCRRIPPEPPPPDLPVVAPVEGNVVAGLVVLGAVVAILKLSE